MGGDPQTRRPERATAVRFPTVAASAAHYESVYLVAHHPQDGQAVWIRYTVHHPPGGESTGSVWLTLFRRGQAPRALKVTLPLDAVHAPEDGYVAVGPSSIGPTRAVGSVSAAGTDAAWDLSLESSEPPLHHLPAAWLYDAPVPRTKAVSPHPAARFSGALTLDGEQLDLDGWTGMVGHNWGTQHAERWIWLHAENHGGTWVDLALARVRVGGALLPWMAVGALSVDGERRRLGGLTHRPRVKEQVDSCEVRVQGCDVAVTLRARSPRDAIVAWQYADPDGRQHHTMNSSIADLDLEISGWTGAPPRLTVQGSAVYELGLPAGSHGIPVQPFPDG